MKEFIDKVIKKGKQNVKELEEPISTKDEATKAMVKSIKEEAPYKVEPAVEKVKVPNPWPKPLHHPSCVCFKCERWKGAEKNAK
jgi:hypothetical protein